MRGTPVTVKGIDTGFCYPYFMLSYRRKFIRTLWMLPFCAVLPFLPIPRAGLIALLTFLSCIVQGAYNYMKWQAEKKAIAAQEAAAAEAARQNPHW
jgi:hypothetical protein